MIKTLFDDYTFDADKTIDSLVAWIRDFFDKNGKDCKAVVAISGGKDSSVVASLCTKALGKDRVFGVLMPCGEQADIDFSHKLVEHLGIGHVTINIKDAVCSIKENAGRAFLEIGDERYTGIEFSRQSSINLPARIRMASVYAISQSINGRVANTCNLSEDWVGYSTRYGDAAGDFSPLANLTVTEVKEVGRALNLPSFLVDKTPIDGLSGKSDEENLGFTYNVLDRYIRTGICEDADIKNKIDYKRKNNRFKLELMPAFEFDVPVKALDM